MDMPMQPLPGFRDFLPANCAARNYTFAKWREVARRYGFVEWDGPVLEPTELYRKKAAMKSSANFLILSTKANAKSRSDRN